MAEIPPKPENSGKIVCRSRQAVTFYSEILYNSLTKSLEENEQRTEEERRRYLQKFKEIYERVVQENIVLNGETWEATVAETTPEYEPVDRKKELLINEELLPQLDDYVVKVARRRKRLPHTCVNAVSDFSNHQAVYMSKVKPSAKEINLVKAVSNAKDVTRFISCQRLQEPCATLADLTKTVPKDQERAVHVSKAVEIEAADRNSQTAAVLYSCSPVKDNAHHSVCAPCLCKRKLGSNVFDAHTANSKVARSSFVLAKDFAVC